MGYEFRWIEWNIDHIARHGVTVEEAEFVVDHPMRRYPRRARNQTYIAVGQTSGGRYLQVVYVFDDPDPGVPRTVFILHARSLNDAEKRRI